MISNLQKELRKAKNPKRGKVIAGFFKTGKGQYGERDKFLGVSVPQIRIIIKKHQELTLDVLQDILQSKFHEERFAVLLILISQFEKGDAKKQKDIFKFYLKNTKWINNWDLVDVSAHRILGSYLQDKPKDALFKLAESKILWERRMAMVATFFEIKGGDGNTALAMAEKLLNDRHDLMHKAVGWMLREVGKHCSRAEEEIFLKKYAGVMPRTTLRYALEHFEKNKRQQYLKYKKTNSKRL